MTEPLRTPPPSPPVSIRTEDLPEEEVKSKASVVQTDKQILASSLPKPSQTLITERQCSLCRSLMARPYQASCGHRFHQSCAQALMDNNELCPVADCEDKTIAPYFPDNNRRKEYSKYDWSEWLDSDGQQITQVKPQGELISNVEYEFHTLNIDKNKVPESTPVSSSEHSQTPNVVDGSKTQTTEQATPLAAPQARPRGHTCASCAARLNRAAQCSHPDTATSPAGPGIGGRSLQEEHNSALGDLLTIEHRSAAGFKASLPLEHDKGAEQLWNYLKEQPEGFVGVVFNLHFDDQLVPFKEKLMETLGRLKDDQSLFVAFQVNQDFYSYTVPVQFYRKPGQDSGEGQLRLLASMAAPRDSERLIAYQANSPRALVDYLLNRMIICGAGETAIFELDGNSIAMISPDQFHTFMLPEQCIDMYPFCSATDFELGDMHRAYSRNLGLTVHDNEQPNITANIVHHRQQNPADDALLLVEFCQNGIEKQLSLDGRMDFSECIPQGSAVSEDVLVSLLRANHDNLLTRLYQELKKSTRTIARIDLRVGTSAERQQFYLIANKESYFFVPYGNEQIRTVSTKDWSKMKNYLEYLLRGHNVEDVTIDLYRKKAPQASKT